MSDAQPQVEFYFDTICPWCWMTSRWASEVAEVRGFEITWKPISLKIINEKNVDHVHGEAHRKAHGYARVVEAARVAAGDAAVGKLYTELGTRIHPGARTDMDEIIAESLAAAGLDAALADAVNDETTDVQLRETTNHALEIAGPDVGVPIISIDGKAFFGPVVTPAPSGADALKLWDALHAASQIPGFYELKRGRTVGPQL